MQIKQMLPVVYIVNRKVSYDNFKWCLAEAGRFIISEDGKTATYPYSGHGNVWGDVKFDKGKFRANMPGSVLLIGNSSGVHRWKVRVDGIEDNGFW